MANRGTTMSAMNNPPRHQRSRLVEALPRLGYPGSRSAQLHLDGVDPAPARRLPIREANRFSLLRILGTVGALLIGIGGLGAGALPVVDNPYGFLPGGAVMARMLQASSAIVLIGVAMLVAAWALMAPFIGARNHRARLAPPIMLRTFIAWTLPLLFTAPLFTQDIYSYLAQGAVVAQGLDPYSAGPVELLGPEHHLARSVPFIWAESPSPYGPVALGIAATISWLSSNSIVAGVLLHRAVSLVFVLAAAWAIIALARRCGVAPATALWLGILNPLTILHLIGGIHNESIMLGLMLVGIELGLRGIDRIARTPSGFPRDGWALFVASSTLISCAGMVKVTGFVALGFTGMALARVLGGWRGIARSVVIQILILLASIVVVSAATGIELGWITGQGGAASIRSWLSMSTNVGVIFGFVGMLLGLGDHTETLLVVTRAVGVFVAGGFTIRMLWATFRGSIHPVGALGVSMLVVVILFPVVHPWYMLWAILPLAAWANRIFFRRAVVGYSVFFSFIVLPRGLSLPPGTVASIYLSALLGAIVLAALAWLWVKRMRV